MTATLPPETVRIGPHDYKVVLVPDGVLDDAGRFGHASIERLVIALDGTQPPSQAAATLLHECLHAMLDLTDLDGDAEERVALLLGPGLLDFILDNPDLIRYLRSTRKG